MNKNALLFFQTSLMDIIIISYVLYIFKWPLHFNTSKCAFFMIKYSLPEWHSVHFFLFFSYFTCLWNHKNIKY